MVDILSSVIGRHCFVAIFSDTLSGARSLAESRAHSSERSPTQNTCPRRSPNEN